jgi:hypothetical protein
MLELQTCTQHLADQFNKKTTGCYKQLYAAAAAAAHLYLPLTTTSNYMLLLLLLTCICPQMGQGLPW